jgi:hypothetical protein
MKKLILAFVFLVAGVAVVPAATTLDLTNNSGNAAYDGSGIEVYANTSAKGWINLYTGPVASLLASGGSFSGTGAWFTYSVPKVSSATTQTVPQGSGNVSSVTLVLLSTSTSGGTTLRTYQLSMTFSGYDIYGHSYSGQTIQLIKMKTNQTGVGVTDVGGTTEVQVN